MHLINIIECRNRSILYALVIQFPAFASFLESNISRTIISISEADYLSDFFAIGTNTDGDTPTRARIYSPLAGVFSFITEDSDHTRFITITPLPHNMFCSTGWVFSIHVFFEKFCIFIGIWTKKVFLLVHTLFIIPGNSVSILMLIHAGHKCIIQNQFRYWDI